MTKLSAVKLFLLLLRFTVITDSNLLEFTPSEADHYCVENLNDGSDSSPQEWYDESCRKYQCVNRNGTLFIEVSSCSKPDHPTNATGCYEYTDNTSTIYPFCCPILRCNGRQSQRDDGQSIFNMSVLPLEIGIGHTSKRYKRDTMTQLENMKLLRNRKLKNYSGTVHRDLYFPLVSSEENEDKEDVEPQKSPRSAPEKLPQDSQDRLGTANEQKTFFDWLIWPFEFLLLSESELLRIFKSRDEELYQSSNYEKNR